MTRRCRYCPLAWTVEHDDSDVVLYDSDTTCPECGSNDAVPAEISPPDACAWGEYV